MKSISAELIHKCRGLRNAQIEKIIGEILLISSDWMLVHYECRRHLHTLKLRSISLDKALQTATCLKDLITIAERTKSYPRQHKEAIEKILSILVRIQTVPSNEEIELLQNSSLERLKAAGWLFAGKREFLKPLSRIMAVS